MIVSGTALASSSRSAESQILANPRTDPSHNPNNASSNDSPTADGREHSITRPTNAKTKLVVTSTSEKSGISLRLLSNLWDARIGGPTPSKSVAKTNKMALHKLVVLGDGGVGKTELTIQVFSLILNTCGIANFPQFTLQHFVKTYDPSIEDSYRKQAIIDGQYCMLEILDSAGQEEYTALRDQWIRDGEGFVLVYSISSRSSFSRMQRFHNQITRVKESAKISPSYPGTPISAPSAPSAPFHPIMLVGNNCDRVTEREVSTQEGRALASELGCGFVEASPKTGVNVEKVFHDVVRMLRRQGL
jgi:GTPase KRas